MKQHCIKQIDQSIKIQLSLKYLHLISLKAQRETIKHITFSTKKASAQEQQLQGL